MFEGPSRFQDESLIGYMINSEISGEHRFALIQTFTFKGNITSD